MIKVVLIFAAAVYSVGSLADAVCPVHFICGSYKFSVLSDDGRDVVTSVVVTGKSAEVAQYDYTITSGAEETESWKLTTKFAADGSFTMALPDGSVYAAGICAGTFCTYGMHPWVKSDKTTGNAGMLVFETGKLTLNMFYGAPGKIGESRQVFTKQ